MGANCPYDDTHCVQKDTELAKFRHMVHALAASGANRVFFQGDGNTINQDECVRYQRYQNIINKMNKINARDR